MKLLLYCTKSKPYLRDYRGKAIYNRFVISPSDRPFTSDDTQPILNGKIVAECDFEVEKIRKGWGCLNGTKYFRNSVDHYYPDYELEQQSCLGFNEIDKYLKGTLNENCGYAIHIKNLHIFDKPKELNDYTYFRTKLFGTLGNAPQNMMYVYDNGVKKILISIQPQWMCLILNHIKDVEVRRVVLKEMLG